MKKSWYTSAMVGDVPGIPVAVIALGILIAIVGFSQSSQYYNTYKACHSILGRFAREYSGLAQGACSTADSEMALASVLVIGGLVLIALGVVFLNKGRAAVRAATAMAGMTASGSGYGAAPPAVGPPPSAYCMPSYGSAPPATGTYAAPGPPTYGPIPSAPSAAPSYSSVPPLPTPPPASTPPAVPPPPTPAARPALKGKLAKPSS